MNNLFGAIPVNCLRDSEEPKPVKVTDIATGKVRYEDATLPQSEETWERIKKGYQVVAFTERRYDGS